MHNAVTLEGIVVSVNPRHRMARLAVYRSPARKRTDADGRELPDYVSVRYTDGQGRYLHKGSVVVVIGYLQSRDYQEPVGRVVRRAGVSLPDAVTQALDGATVKRVATEVVAERVILARTAPP